MTRPPPANNDVNSLRDRSRVPRDVCRTRNGVEQIICPFALAHGTLPAVAVRWGQRRPFVLDRHKGFEIVLSPRHRLPLCLAVLYAAIWVWAAIAPLFPSDWLLENLLVFIAVIAVAWGYRRKPFSNATYVLITLFLALHTIGSHYTYAETPVGFWMQDAFDLDRNHYDRVVHFSFGLLLVLPVRELIERTDSTHEPWLSFFAATIIATASAVYEVIEWGVAQVVSPEAALAYLGTQGDVFDGQKDMALAMLGAAIALPLGAMINGAVSGRQGRDANGSDG
jgi:putative membrane protein